MRSQSSSQIWSDRCAEGWVIPPWDNFTQPRANNLANSVHTLFLPSLRPDVGAVPLLLLHLLDEGDGVVLGHVALLGHDLLDQVVHVLRIGFNQTVVFIESFMVSEFSLSDMGLEM